MNTTHTVTVSPAPNNANTRSVSAATGPSTPALRVSFAPHNATSGDETPSIADKAITATEQWKRAKLGPDIVALIELQKPTAIQELIFDLSTTMIALNAKVYECTESTKHFDFHSVPMHKKTWLPGNVKKIKISLQCTSELADDEEYLKLSAVCDKTVMKFQEDLNYLYYCAAIRERKHAKEKWLCEFIEKSHKLFQAYTKHFSGFIKMGNISRPLDITAAQFLIRYMKEGYNKAFFHPDKNRYLGNTLEEATNAVAELVPGLRDPDAPENLIPKHNSEIMAKTEKFRNSKGFMLDEEDVYQALRNSIDPYFATVTCTIQK
jgi:hypothetical protein